MNWRELLAWMQALWTVAYGLMIWRGWRDECAAIPAVGNVGCLGWEFTMVAFFLPAGSVVWYLVFSWLICSLVLAVQIYKYRTETNVLFTAILVVVVWVMMGWVMVLPGGTGVVAALVNLVVSISFVVMLFERRSVAGQSFYIAVVKFLASLGSLATIQAGEWYYLAPMLVALAVDVAYIALLVRQCRRQGVNFLLRFP